MQLLGEHPRVVTVNEPLIGDHLGPILCDRRGIRASDLDSTNFTLNRLRRNSRSYFFADEFKDVWQPPLGDLMRARFLAHAAKHHSSALLSKTIVVIKEPNGSQASDLIMQALPRARMMFLVRDGRDVIDSGLDAAKRGSWLTSAFPTSTDIAEGDRFGLVIDYAHKWLWNMEVVEEAFNAHTGPKYWLRYEDLLADTPQQLKKVFEWLELEIEDAQVAEIVTRHSFDQIPDHLRGPGQFHRAATPGLWRKNLRPDEQEAIQTLIAPKLRQLGYQA